MIDPRDQSLGMVVGDTPDTHSNTTQAEQTDPGETPSSPQEQGVSVTPDPPRRPRNLHEVYGDLMDL